MDNFGGMNITQDFAHHSNIIFSNGVLDPCRSGGVQQYVNNDLPFFIIQGGAHHTDLREPHPADSESLTWVRQQEMELIGKWIRDYQPALEVEQREVSQFLQ